MANLPQENFIDTRELVEKLTGLREGKRFEQCYDYAVANLFQASKFLDVNGHKILRMVDGLRDKFYIHAQSQKADHFYSLCQDLLKSSVFKDNGTADVPFSILCLLFELANRPTEAEYVYAPEEDFTKDRKEGESSSTKSLESVQELDSRRPWRSASPISDLSDWSDDGEIEQRLEPKKVEALAAAVNDREKCTVSSKPEIRMGGDASKAGLSGRAWLYQNLDGSSWGQMSCTGSEKMHDLQAVVNASLLREERGDNLFLSERQIIREVLWMLEGRKEGRVFEFNDEDHAFVVNPNVRASHLTQEALCRFLLPLANSGSNIQMLRQFVEEVIEVNAPLSAVSPTQTYKAYASAISQTLCLLTKDVAKLSKPFLEQRCTFTLSMLVENLDLWGRKMDVLGTLHRNGVKSGRPDWSAAARAAHLLNTLYSTVSELDVLGDNVFEEMELVLSVFLTSIRPYLDIIDVWIIEFNLNDPCQEFIIACNTHAKALDETFWTNAIVLREISWVKRGSTDTSAVAFLQPVLQMLVLIGRSVEVLRHLGAVGHLVKHDSQPLFSSIAESFAGYSADETRLIRFEDVAEGVGNAAGNPHLRPRPSRRSVTVADNLDSKDMYDPILNGYFKRKYFHSRKEDESSPVNNRDAEPSDTREGKNCLRTVLESALLANVAGKFEHICRSLLDLFNNEYQLKETLFAFRRYFLMKAGDVMFQFTSQMFDTIPPQTLAYKRAELNLLLEDALSIFSPKDATNLSVDVDKRIAKECKSAIGAYDSVRLVYEVSWPLTIIIDSTCKRRYDRVFTFLLRLKYAKYRLDELQFRDLRETIPSSSPERQKKTRQMYICRVKLMHFVNGLHNHVLTHVLQDTEAMCGEIYGRNSDLERIIGANEDYTNAVYERCLLHPAMSTVAEAVTKILGLALDFSGSWTNSGNVSFEDVRGVERDLDAICERIESFVQFVSLKESSPYLESLVSSCCYARTKNG